MSFWSKAALTLAGAAAGYFAARRGPAVVRTGRELVLRGPSALSEQTPSPGGNAMARFWSSSAAAPLRAGALKAVRFAATVKQGMAEKESELNRRYGNLQAVGWASPSGFFAVSDPRGIGAAWSFGE